MKTSASVRKITDAGFFSVEIIEPEYKPEIDILFGILKSATAEKYDCAIINVNGEFSGEVCPGEHITISLSDVEMGTPGKINFTATFFREGAEVASVSDSTAYDIESWHVSARHDFNSPITRQAVPGAIAWYNPPNFVHGASNKFFLLCLRVPAGKKIQVIATSDESKEVIGLPVDGHNYKYGDKAEVHFRGPDYRNRGGDEYTLDMDNDLWLFSPREYTEGIHHLYVCPSNAHDRSMITVRIEGDISCGYRMLSKSLAR